MAKINIDSNSYSLDVSGLPTKVYILSYIMDGMLWLASCQAASEPAKPPPIIITGSIFDIIIVYNNFFRNCPV